MYKFGARKTGELHLHVKQRELGPRAKVMNEKNRGQKAELITSLTTMLTIQEQSVTNYKHSAMRKALIMPARTDFSPQLSPELCLDIVWAAAMH